jgi:cytochrome c-type biogenesis protein CcmF
VIAPLGRFLILVALFAATAGAIIAFAAAWRQSSLGLTVARRLAYAFAGALGLANALMIHALVTHDFSVSYVAMVGSRASPAWVSVVSLWSSLEGSILFWGLVLGGFIAVATWLYGNRFPREMPWALGVWLGVGAFFSFLLAGPAQPFGTVSPVPLDGPGPNPLLQNHILMIIHPPLLYLGYVGMTIPFGLASGALLSGRLGPEMLRTMRTWVLLPWTFLTVAIVAGGWWAYEVLGWGGYWAWDPVENASLLPWLTATAALHSAVLMERRGILKGWTCTLVLATFLLTILGTFMTRSGVFNSVHSFTQSAIGPTLLVFLAICLVWSVVILAWRIDALSSPGSIESPRSREGMFLFNNLLFVLFTFTVLIGTVFPLVVEAVRGVQMSVGGPYFDKMAVPIGVTLLFLMGVGPALPWGRASGQQIRRALLPPLAGGAVLLAVGLAMGVGSYWTLATLFAGGYAAQITLVQLWRPVAQRRRQREEGVVEAFVEGQWRRGRRRLGAYVVHAAVVVIIVAIAVSSTQTSVIEQRMVPGDSAAIGPYTLTFQGLDTRPQPHRTISYAAVAVERGGRELAVMRPSLNIYGNQREPINTPHVRHTWRHDLYLSLISVDPEGPRIGLRAQINPMVVWIWIATGLMGVGGIIALIPARRAQRVRVAAPGEASDSHGDALAGTTAAGGLAAGGGQS